MKWSFFLEIFPWIISPKFPRITIQSCTEKHRINWCSRKRGFSSCEWPIWSLQIFDMTSITCLKYAPPHFNVGYLSLACKKWEFSKFGKSSTCYFWERYQIFSSHKKNTTLTSQQLVWPGIKIFAEIGTRFLDLTLNLPIDAFSMIHQFILNKK